MKKIIILGSLAFIILSCNEKIALKNSFLPDHNYKIHSREESQVEIILNADEQKLKEFGMESPVNIFIFKDIKQTIETSEVDSNGSINFHSIIENIIAYQERNGKRTELESTKSLVGMQSFGKFSKENKTKIDSVKGDNLSTELKQQLPDFLNSMFSNIQYPDYPLGIGDKFIQELPLAIPVGETNLNIIMTYEYILAEVSDKEAIFNIKSMIELKKDNTEENVRAGGNGDGLLIHNLDLNYSTNYTTNIEMVFESKTEEMLITQKIISKSSIKTEIYNK